MTLVAETSGSWMFAAGIALATTILIRRLWRRRSARPNSGRGLEPVEREQPLGDAPPEVLRWQVEMHQLARQLKGEIDSKIRVWDALVREARQEREKLERTLKVARAEAARRDSA